LHIDITSQRDSSNDKRFAGETHHPFSSEKKAVVAVNDILGLSRLATPLPESFNSFEKRGTTNEEAGGKREIAPSLLPSHAGVRLTLDHFKKVVFVGLKQNNLQANRDRLTHVDA
jgi:hypothetical protein